MSESGITIVIPVYNRAELLPRTLASIDRQTMPPDRVILVDNNSTDSSAQVMEEWRRSVKDFPVLLLSETTPGAAAARNRGLREVDSPYVMFFDSDDEMLPTHIEDFARTLRQNPDAQIAGKPIRKCGLHGETGTGAFTTIMPEFQHIFRATLSTQRIVVSTDFCRSVGAWNEEILAWNDFELGVRYLLASPRIVHVPGDPTVVVYSQKRSITGTDFTSGAGRWEKSLSTCRTEILRAGRTDLLPWIDARYAILAAQYAREGSHRLASDLLRSILSLTPFPRRIRLLYHHNRLFGRFTWCLARLLFPC